MIRRSATQKIGDNNIPKDALPTEVDANSKVIIDKFALLSRIGSRNISFRGLEVGQEKDGHVNGVTITPEVVISTCLKNFTKLNLSLISWTLDGRVNNNLTSGFGHLRSLKLFNCQIGPRDCCNLSRALKDNKNIKSLDLSYNRIVGVHAFRNEVLGTYDSAGLLAVLSAILRSATIENLNLYGNYLGGIQCSKTPVSLKKRTEVQVSKATATAEDFNCSGTTTVEIIKEFLFLNQSVRILNLNANEFNNDNGTAESLLSHLKLHSNHCTMDEIKNSPCIYFEVSEKRRKSNESNSCHCTTADLGRSPCQSLCGIIPENSRSDYDNLQYSNFRPPDPDLVDLSNMSLESFTGSLIG
jgi:hypothetical protein